MPLSPFTWSKYSRKLQKRIDQPHSFGVIDSVEDMRLVTGHAENLTIQLLIDEDDGCIADARFKLFGDSALFGAAEVLCSLLLRKNYLQAGRLSAELIDREVRDYPDQPAFPEETGAHLNLCLRALDEALEQCDDIPIADEPPPMPIQDTQGEESAYPNWLELSEAQKTQVIEGLISEEIRPYIELDAGGIEIVSIEDFKVTIAYQGACTTCYSAVGATLNAITQILKRRIHSDITVVPSGLQF